MGNAEALKSLRDSGYMELDVFEPGPFSCAACSHRMGEVCTLLKAVISPVRGCCNAFSPDVVGLELDEEEWAENA